MQHPEGLIYQTQLGKAPSSRSRGLPLAVLQWAEEKGGSPFSAEKAQCSPHLRSVTAARALGSGLQARRQKRKVEKGPAPGRKALLQAPERCGGALPSFSPALAPGAKLGDARDGSTRSSGHAEPGPGQPQQSAPGRWQGATQAALG